MDFAAAVRELPVRWRWEGKCGHPRVMADAVARLLQDKRYSITRREGDMKAQPLAGVVEFEGSLTGYLDYPAARTDHRLLLFFGILLFPLIIGILLLFVAFHKHRRMMLVEWRGECYEAEGHIETGRETSGVRAVVSEVRLAIRGGVGDRVREGQISKVMRRPTRALTEDVASLIQELEKSTQTDLCTSDLSPRIDRKEQFMISLHRDCIAQSGWNP